MRPRGRGARGPLTVPDRPAVDVVVVAYNSRDTLRSCVEPLVRAAVGERDRGRQRVPRALLGGGRGPPGVRDRGVAAQRRLRLRLQPRRGGGLGRVRAAAQPGRGARPSAASAQLIDALRADPRLAAVGPRTIDEAEASSSSRQRRFPRLRSTYAQALFLHRAAPLAAWSDDAVRDREAYERPGTPDWLSGCLPAAAPLGVRVRLGGLDEGFFLYAEETDLFRRLATAGWRVGYEPRAVASHTGRRSAPAARPRGTSARTAACATRASTTARSSPAWRRLGLALGDVTHAAAWITRPRSRPRARSTPRAPRCAPLHRPSETRCEQPQLRHRHARAQRAREPAAPRAVGDRPGAAGRRAG